MQFYIARNNGVTAVISAGHASLYGTFTRAISDPREAASAALMAGVRIFTFADPKRFERRPEDRHILTGSTKILERLLEYGGHAIINENSRDWNGYVPFSNGFESLASRQQQELAYRTTLEDVLLVFGSSAFAAAAVA